MSVEIKITHDDPKMVIFESSRHKCELQYFPGWDEWILWYDGKRFDTYFDKESGVNEAIRLCSKVN